MTFDKLYFTADFSPENVAKLKGEGWVLRNNAIHSEGIEPAKVYGGDLPQNYIDAGIESVTAKAKTQPAQKPKTDVKD